MVQETVFAPRRFLSEKERMLRRERIFARLREGWAYADIAHAEGLSSKRISQIVGKALQKRTTDSASDHAMLQLARLEPALRLAAGALADGDVEAISPYLKLLDRLDRYQKPLAAVRRLRRQGAPKTARQDEPHRRPHPCRRGEARREGGGGHGRGPAAGGQHRRQPADEAEGKGASQTGNDLDSGLSP